MALITTRETEGFGAFNKNAPLSNTDFDLNLINLNQGISISRGNLNISGGGLISLSSSFNVSWTQRFIIISNSRGSTTALDGYWEIVVPPVNTVITGVGGASNRTVTSNGIQLNGWDALYYILPLGSSGSSIPQNFRIANYTQDLNIPSNWIKICLRNLDNNIVSFFNGINLTADDNTLGYETHNSVPNSLVSRDTNGNFSANIITAKLNGDASTALDLAAQAVVDGGSF
jgi:hypothetical protein